MSRARSDDELPPLPSGLSHLKGPALVRAAWELARAKPESARWAPRKPAPLSVSTPAPFAPPTPLPGPVRGTPAEPTEREWTPRDSMPCIPTPGHWADGIPIDDEPPPEEDR